MYIKEFVLHHLLSHSARPFGHVQHPLVKLSGRWRSPQAAFSGQFRLGLQPLLQNGLKEIILWCNRKIKLLNKKIFIGQIFLLDTRNAECAD